MAVVHSTNIPHNVSDSWVRFAYIARRDCGRTLSNPLESTPVLEILGRRAVLVPWHMSSV